MIKAVVLYVGILLVSVPDFPAEVPDYIPEHLLYGIGKPFPPPPRVFKRRTMCLLIKLKVNKKPRYMFWCTSWESPEKHIPIEI